MEVKYCCKRVALYLFFFFNHLFFILGALVVGIGTWILIDQKTFSPILQTTAPSFQVGIYLFIAVGAVTMVLGFLGCVGVACDIKCALGLYFACLVVILSAQVTAGLMIYFQQNSLKTRMPEVVVDLFHSYNPSNDTNRVLDVAWDFVQLKFSCCGWSGPEDWQLNKILWASNMSFYPCSCSNQTKDLSIGIGFCPVGTQPNATAVADWPVKKKGCWMGVENWLQEYINIFLGVSVGVVIIEVLGIGHALCLCSGKAIL